MSRRRALIMAAGGADIPTSGLVFYASFRENTSVAESGHSMYNTGEGETGMTLDAMLQREVCYINTDDCLGISGEFPPTGNSPFTMSMLAKVVDGGSENICPLMVWGSTPYGATVAAFRWDDEMVTFTAWGDNYHRCDYVAMPLGEWHHLCGVNDGNGHASFYFDGKLKSVGNFDFNIGDEVFSFSSFWSPERAEFFIANARIYNRVLSDNEVKALSKEV